MVCRVLLPLITLPVLCTALLSAPVTAQGPGTREAPSAEPKTGLDWLRRADSQTNIRMFGSTPFHMRVTFHAYPGMDFTSEDKSPILTGDGTYEEWWISPKQWQREVTLGSYHAIEVEADGVRKFQASSDYEPSRVMMLMSALLVPIPRFIVEEDLQEKRIHWKLEHLTAGSLPYLRISYRYEQGLYGPEVRAYEFLPSGILVRSEEDYTALLTTWQDDAPFSGKTVPRHLSVRGSGLSGEMVTAEIAVEAVGSGFSIEQVAGDPADPGATLQPLPYMKRSEGGHVETPGSYTTSMRYPADVKTSVTWIFDRNGNAREIEVSGVRLTGQPLSAEQSELVSDMARRMVAAARKDRSSFTVDGSPCQSRFAMTMWLGQVSSF